MYVCIGPAAFVTKCNDSVNIFTYTEISFSPNTSYFPQVNSLVYKKTGLFCMSVSTLML